MSASALTPISDTKKSLWGQGETWLSWQLLDNKDFAHIDHIVISSIPPPLPHMNVDFIGALMILCSQGVECSLYFLEFQIT